MGAHGGSSWGLPCLERVAWVADVVIEEGTHARPRLGLCAYDVAELGGRLPVLGGHQLRAPHPQVRLNTEQFSLNPIVFRLCAPHPKSA